MKSVLIEDLLEVIDLHQDRVRKENGSLESIGVLEVLRADFYTLKEGKITGCKEDCLLCKKYAEIEVRS